MTCTELDELIEPLAAGELDPTPAIEAHLATCARCRAAYAVAASIERVLATQPAPAAPDGFVASVMTEVRRYRWRSEQYLDLAFNVLVGLTIVVAIGGLYALLTVSGLAAVSADVVRLFVRSAIDLSATMRPQLSLYVGMLLLVLSGAGLWWWAEQGFDM